MHPVRHRRFARHAQHAGKVVVQVATSKVIELRPGLAQQLDKSQQQGHMGACIDRRPLRREAGGIGQRLHRFDQQRRLGQQLAPVTGRDALGVHVFQLARQGLGEGQQVERVALIQRRTGRVKRPPAAGGLAGAGGAGVGNRAAGITHGIRYR